MCVKNRSFKSCVRKKIFDNLYDFRTTCFFPSQFKKKKKHEFRSQTYLFLCLIQNFSFLVYLRPFRRVVIYSKKMQYIVLFYK